MSRSINAPATFIHPWAVTQRDHKHGNTAPRNYGKALALERMIVRGPNSPGTPVVADSLDEPRASRLFHFSHAFYAPTFEPEPH
jgi:hypothetical protein